MLNYLKKRQIFNYLTKSNPEKLMSGVQKDAIAAFQRAYKNIPAYQKLINEYSINNELIKNIEDFKNKIPVIDKNNYFTAFAFNEFFKKSDFRRLKNIMTSSGFSGKFAFGADLQNSSKGARFFIDTILDLLFQTSKKKTFLINCTPMGVHVETSLPIAETSVRSDMVIALLEKVSPFYDQTIIIGDPYFMKKVVEEGCDKGVDWKKLGVNLILGQDWFPESFRTYLAGKMNLYIDTDNDRFILATMGLTELGLNVFHETPETVRIRRRAQLNNNLKRELFGVEKKVCGYLFHYYPMRFYIEQSQENAFLFTTLSKSAVIPLVRYYSGDSGRLLTYNDLLAHLNKYSLNHLKPSLKLPLAIMNGRAHNFINVDETRIYPEELKQGLYENMEAAGLTTGYFIVTSKEGKVTIEVQLKHGIDPNEADKTIFKEAFNKYVSFEINVILYKYSDFPYGMELTYEKKFVNLA